jgi:hypothetical protein
MEAVGTAVGIASLGIQVCQGLLSYYSDWKDYNLDISSTYDAITDLGKTLILLKSTLGREEVDQERAERVKTCLQDCEAALLALENERHSLQRYVKPEGKREKVRLVLQRSWYPFKKETLEKLKDNVVGVQERLKFALQVLQLDINTASQNLLLGLRSEAVTQGASLAQLSAQNQRILDAQHTEEYKKIVAWLSAADPWTNHDSARQRHENLTGDWLLRSEQYQNWKLSTGRHIWMYGKAGCGKTVLCSTAVEDIRDHCQQSVNTVCAFFYFSFSDEHKQSDADLLRSLVTQLGSREPALSMLRQAYAKSSRTVPGLEELEKILLASIKSYDTVFLFLDALDECAEENDVRQGVLERIETLTSDALNLNIFTTSRELTQIRESMDTSNFGGLRIATSAVDADIRTYVSMQLSRDRHFRKFGLATLSMIETTIAGKADGM